MPRWLQLLLVGGALGAGAVLLVQHRYLPPRLSAEASAELRASLAQANSERLRLTGQLAATEKRLQAALAETQALDQALAASRAASQTLRDDVQALVDALPPDPRGGAVQVRSARFTTEGGRLLYDVVLTRARTGGKPLSGVVQLVVAGEGVGPATTLEPIPVSIGAYESVRGDLALPANFEPRQTTIRVLDDVGGKQLGMRVMHVK